MTSRQPKPDGAGHG